MNLSVANLCVVHTHRQVLIDQYNSSEDILVFLLSTKAGECLPCSYQYVPTTAMHSVIDGYDHSLCLYVPLN